MSTKWVVTTAAERIDLGEKRTGEITFTVNNPNGRADRVMFDPVVSEQADESWFTVEEPQRLVRAGASVPYVMKVAVPATAPPGEYAVQARVYSADSAPEESSVLSPRVMLAVPAPPEPVKRKWPWWWWLVAAGLVLVLLIGIGVLVFGGGGDDEGSPTPTAAPVPQAGEVVMPDLLGESERDALRALAELGITVRPIKYRHDPERADQVLAQSPEPGSATSSDAVVDLEVAVELVAPTITSQAGVLMLEPGAEIPTLEWESGQPQVRHWQVTWSREQCYFRSPVLYNNPVNVISACSFPADGIELADTPSLTPELTIPAPVFGYAVKGDLYSGWVQWQVAAQDDFGTVGPASEPAYFRVAMP